VKVRLHVKGWKGDHQVPLAESTVLLLTKIEFENREIDFSGQAYLNLGEANQGDFITLQLGGMHPPHFEALDPDDYTWGSTPAQTGILVSEFEIVEDRDSLEMVRDSDWERSRAARRDVVGK
jgi:hypothetical protein